MGGVRVELVNMGFDQLIDAVAARRVDAAISAMPAPEDRTREVSFSQSYLEAGLVLATPPCQSYHRHGQSDRQAVWRREWGSEGDAKARELKKAAGETITLVLEESAAEALAATADGEADAALVDAVSLALFQRDGGALMAVGPAVVSQPYVVILPARTPEIVAAVNAAIVALRADGTLDRIRAQWLSAEIR